MPIMEPKASVRCKNSNKQFLYTTTKAFDEFTNCQPAHFFLHVVMETQKTSIKCI